MMLKRSLAFAALVLMHAACAQTLHNGDPVDLSGRLALRGNEPFVYPVVYDERGVFELEGITRGEALMLQNRQVSVHGTITRADPGGARLPAVHVELLRTVQPATTSPAP
jgi:hypothetical protein